MRNLLSRLCLAIDNDAGAQDLQTNTDFLLAAYAAQIAGSSPDQVELYRFEVESLVRAVEELGATDLPAVLKRRSELALQRN